MIELLELFILNLYKNNYNDILGIDTMADLELLLYKYKPTSILFENN